MVSLQEQLSLQLGGVQDAVHGVHNQLTAYIQAEQDLYRGVKWMRLPLMQGTPSGSALSIGEGAGQECGPEEGYFWALRRLVVAGLTSGATPDVVNLYRGTSSQQGGLLWQFNGNNFGYTFGRTELTLMPGDRLALVSVGTFAATGQITLSGELNSVPAEMMGKLIL